jgi:hypothetical protein
LAQAVTFDDFTPLTVGCVAVIDLNGFDLRARVIISTGQRLTIDDTSSAGNGTLTARSVVSGQPGIRTAGAALLVVGGRVTATSGDAGIGGTSSGSGGSGVVTVSGGTVNATGGFNAAGIGGGGGTGAGAVVTVSGGTVTAQGGFTAVGGGQFGSFGSLVVEDEGRLRLTAGELVVPSGGPDEVEITVGHGGQILGRANDPTDGAQIVGDGSIANDGVIALNADLVTGEGVRVSGDHYRVSFETDGGNPAPDEVVVCAPSFDTGFRDFPADPIRDDDRFQGWFDQRGGVGTPITSDGGLPGSSDGQPVEIVASADWVGQPDAATSTIAADPTSLIADGTSTATVTGTSTRPGR